MALCNDCWCEHYGKGHADCGPCPKKSATQEKPELKAALQRQAVKQMEIDKKRRTNEQSR